MKFKFYNPFKAHVVELANGEFAVRKGSGFLWEYMEHTTSPYGITWWYGDEYVKLRCIVDTLEKAISLRDYVKNKVNPMKAVKIHG